MGFRAHRRAFLAMLATVLGSVVIAVGIAVPASASSHAATDGSAGRPMAASGSTSLLRAHGTPLSPSVNVDKIYRKATALAEGLTGGGTQPGADPSQSPPPPRAAPRSSPKTPIGTAGAPTSAIHRRPRPHQPVTARHGATRQTAGSRKRPAATAVRDAERRIAAAGRGQHHRAARHTVNGKHRRLVGSQVLHDVVSPGSPAQILMLLVALCAIGTAFMVSLARRRDPKPVRVRSDSPRR